MSFNQDENIGGQALEEGAKTAGETSREMQKHYQRQQIRKGYVSVS